MEYVNLEEYKDRPELIQHEDGTNVMFIHPVPGKENTSSHFAVLFENGQSCTFCKDGRHIRDSSISSFILKPKKVTYVKSLKQIVELFPDSYFKTNGDLILDGRYRIGRSVLCLLGRELPLDLTTRFPKILLEERDE